MAKLRAAVVGAGFIGKQHAEAIRRLPVAELVAVSDRDFSRARSLEADSTFTDYREMLEKTRPDIVHNCTPNSLHYEVNRHALEKGCHVYCEKPFTVGCGQAEELLLLAEQRGLAGGVNFNYRNNAMVREMQARLATGDAGRTLLIHGDYLQDWLQHSTDYSWRFEPEESGGARALPDIGSHWFDLVQTITGRRITAVNASLFTAYDMRVRAVGAETFAGSAGQGEAVAVDTEDGGSIQARLEDGTLVSVVLSQVSGGYKNHLRISVDCERYSMRWQQQSADQLVIGLREGGEHTLYADPGALCESARRFATLPVGHPVAWADALRNSIGEFYEAVATKAYLSGNTTYASFADGLQVMRVVEACLSSSRTGHWVNVEPSAKAGKGTCA